MEQRTHNNGEPEAPPLVLYDGVCALCQWVVAFILRHDPDGLFRFAPLQSDLGRTWLKRAGLAEDALDTVVLVQDGRAYARSEAAFLILRQLRTSWRSLAFLRSLPIWLRDPAYRLVARYRYRVFGRYESCPLPPPGTADRFLDGTFDPSARRA